MKKLVVVCLLFSSLCYGAQPENPKTVANKMRSFMKQLQVCKTSVTLLYDGYGDYTFTTNCLKAHAIIDNASCGRAPIVQLVIRAGYWGCPAKKTVYSRTGTISNQEALTVLKEAHEKVEQEKQF